jgi:hypothetical protein
LNLRPAAAAPPPDGCIALTLRRDKAAGVTASLPRSPSPDGLCGVGLSFQMAPDGARLITRLARDGPAEASRRIAPGDELASVDSRLVAGLTSTDIIRMVKGAPGTHLRLVLLPSRADSDPNADSDDDAAAAGEPAPGHRLAARAEQHGGQPGPVHACRADLAAGRGQRPERGVAQGGSVGARARAPAGSSGRQLDAIGTVGPQEPGNGGGTVERRLDDGLR